MKKVTALKHLIQSPKLEFLMEAHNGLSAKIVEEAGFKGIWASGLSISAAWGIRDNNEASWTQILDAVEFMSDATTIPILLDGDTGYGNFNNMRRLVKKLEQRGVAGVCIEDKLFPKTNSFINADQQPLADIEEFVGKISAGKSAQTDSDFCIVARLEAFIAGWGLGEALRRAEAYRLAGADAILVHSKKSRPDDIECFVKEWGNRLPLVIVPTKYYSTPTERFREQNISVVIWANHALRSAVLAMQKTTTQIFKDECLINVEDKIAPLTEIFRLQGDDELREAEKRYLPVKAKETSAIILAASQGNALAPFTKERPKALIEIQGKPILTRLVDGLNALGIKNISVVRGYKKELVHAPNFETIDNDEFDSTNELYSLWLARKELRGNCMIAYGDTLFRRHILEDLLSSTSDCAVVVDADLKVSRKVGDYAECTQRYSNDFYNKTVQLKRLTSVRENHSDGEWVGLLYLSEKGSMVAGETLENLRQRKDFRQLTLIDLVNEMIASGQQVDVLYTKDGWIDIDEALDLETAGRFYA